MPRRNHVMGRHVRAWSPDRQSRLFDRRRVSWPQRVLHDTRHPTEGGIHDLQSPLLHNANHSDWSEYFNGPRYDARVNALAQEMYASGKRVGLAGLWMRPLFAFVKHYLFKGGFFDGTFGLLIAQKSAASTQLKYARLYHLQMQAAREGKR
ncbi:MAG: hypothetical protein R3236_06640 [Phycisphaeraceae bacterium]|nr:hypothetical protein [Phycisphaeraceae bacterium]